MTGMSDISCDSLHGEKNEGNIYSLLFLVGFSFLFGVRGLTLQVGSQTLMPASFSKTNNWNK